MGHIFRGNGLEKDCQHGMIEGRRTRGRQCLKFMDGIRDVTGCESVVDVLRTGVCGDSLQPKSTLIRRFGKVMQGNPLQFHTPQTTTPCKSNNLTDFVHWRSYVAGA